MASYFLDTSAIVKRQVNEVGHLCVSACRVVAQGRHVSGEALDADEDAWLRQRLLMLFR
jgi:hypothetical protein